VNKLIAITIPLQTLRACIRHLLSEGYPSASPFNGDYWQSGD
jgi:hypothetical protein